MMSTSTILWAAVTPVLLLGGLVGVLGLIDELAAFLIKQRIENGWSWRLRCWITARTGR